MDHGMEWSFVDMRYRRREREDIREVLITAVLADKGFGFGPTIVKKNRVFYT
jgi:hypothetical protein